jgi:Tol biopolymer transport system component
MRTDGTGLRKLTDDGYRDRGPQWSPDGNRIAFWSNRGGTYQLWWINADGSGLQQLTDAPEEIFGYTWSPDGAQIIIALGGGGLMLFDPGKPWRGQTPQELHAREGSLEQLEAAAWSPDGRRVTFGIAHGGITLFDLETRQYHALSDTGALPRWLKDGQRLLFMDGGKFRLLDVQSKEQRHVFSPAAGKAGFFSLSPDNRVLYFNVHLPPEADVWLLTLDATR